VSPEQPAANARISKKTEKIKAGRKTYNNKKSDSHAQEEALPSLSGAVESISFPSVIILEIGLLVSYLIASSLRLFNLHRS
jgi:hypothetical protein